MNTRPIGIDLFAGAGGMSLGFEWAGFDIAASVEIDPIHCATHEFNFPNCATICASVTDVTGEEIRERAGLEDKQIDVVFGGAPCQGFSLIGKRALDDPRNALVHHFVRLVEELAPRYFVFENVKGLTVGKHKAFLKEIIEAFEQGSYDVLLPYQVLNAADYGVPQDRRRLFLIGARRGEKLPTYPEKTESVTVGEAIGDIPDAETFEILSEQDHTQVEYGEPSPYVRRLRELENKPFHYGYRRSYDRQSLTSSRRTDHTQKSRDRFAATEGGTTEPISRFRKLALDGVCNTIRAGTASDRGAFTSPRPIHPIYARCITVREAARLHSYPDWFRFHATKWHGFRQIGNSVPPLLAMAVGDQLRSLIEPPRRRPSKILETGNPALLTYTMAQAAAHYDVPANVIPKRKRRAA